MSLKNRRTDYSWPQTKVGKVTIVTDKRSYAPSDTMKVNVGFRILGGLREAFTPDTWTVAWEDFDKILRLTIRLSVGVQSGLRSRKVAEVKKEVRKASFYWSRDPDLPYRIWAMIIPEDGGPPQIPHNVEDAKSKMLDVEKTFSVPCSALGLGKKKLVAKVSASWGRRTFIEKGSVGSSSLPVAVEVAS
ncbi:MAG TPA: hypothetical protein VEB67_00540 [Nitrososphaerales archaeon]|nr:hypothetical protein [Nitrososphaerales archaeon]